MATRIRAETRRQMEQTARRTATAFGVAVYESRFESGQLWCKGWASPVAVQWTVEAHSLRLNCVMLYRARQSCEVYWNGTYNLWCTDPELISPLVRGLLGGEFTQWSLFEGHLGALSAHERMELMLRVPCEFWPPSWIDPPSSLVDI